MATKKTKGQPSEARCDYCNAELGCLDNSIRAQEYWRGEGFAAFYICEACLPTVMDDFPHLEGEERLLALRLLHARGVNLPRIDETINAARGIVVPRQLAEVRHQREKVLLLRREGELVATVWAAQALWNAANHLNDALESRHARRAGEKVIEGGKKSAERRRHRRPDADSKRARIIDEARNYRGAERAKIATLVRKTGASPQYVGRVLAKLEP